MKKLYWRKCNDYSNIKSHKKVYILDKKALVSIICHKCGSQGEKLYKEKESTEILEIFSLIKNIEKYQMNI